MDLNYKVTGSGDPLIILHGLFGSLDNWQTIAKKLAEDYTVFSVDLRNHGRSPHSEEMSYEFMATDLEEFMHSKFIFSANIIGHSMGGKVAMQFAATNPDMVEKLIVVDIAPGAYSSNHDIVFDALKSVDLSKVRSRSEAESAMRKVLFAEDVVLFLMKGLYRNKDMSFSWRFNLQVLEENYESIVSAIKMDEPYTKPALFIKGSRSEYINKEKQEIIESLFPLAEIREIEGAGHWVHAEAPEEFLEVVREYLG